jgi:2-methylcitrate synthase
MLREVKAAVDGGMSVEDWMADAFEKKKKLMGFGHRVYKKGDHRAPILHALGRRIAARRGGEFLEYFTIGEQVQSIMETRKEIYPNVDFPCGLTYFAMDIPVAQYTPIFVASRVSGWCAHIMEQHANNRLIRPIANYIGEMPRAWG